jgi:hypothetical protein
MNFLVLWFINAQGIAYTFGICSPSIIYARSCGFVDLYQTAAFMPALFLDALGGAIVFLMVKRLLGWRGALISAAAIVVAVNAVANLGFSAYMLLFFEVPSSFYFAFPMLDFVGSLASTIPSYLLLLVPIAAIDVLVNGDGRKALVVASLVMGPLSVFLDGRFSTFSGLWSPGPQTLVYLLPMVAGGLLGGGLGNRLMEALAAGHINGRIKSFLHFG